MSFSQRGEAERETIKEHFLCTFSGSFSRYTEVILKGKTQSTAEGGGIKKEEGGAKKQSKRRKKGNVRSKLMSD